MFNDTFLLTLDLRRAPAPWLEARSLYCLLLSLGIYVSMRREQQRAAAGAATPASMAGRIRRIAGVWTFFALISIWADASAATFGQRVDSSCPSSALR